MYYPEQLILMSKCAWVASVVFVVSWSFLCAHCVGMMPEAGGARSMVTAVVDLIIWTLAVRPLGVQQHLQQNLCQGGLSTCQYIAAPPYSNTWTDQTFATDGLFVKP